MNLKLENLTDEELANLSKNLNDEALEILMKRYKALLSKIVRGYFLLGASKDDVMQEAYIGLYKAVLSYDKVKNASFKTFAMLCVRRNILSAIKKSNSQKNKLLNESVSLTDLKNDEDEESVLFLPSFFTMTDEAIIQNEKFEEVKSLIIKKLSRLELEILKYYLKGYSYSDMAKKLTITTKTVDNALSRIKSKLQFLIK